LALLLAAAMAIGLYLSACTAAPPTAAPTAAPAATAAATAAPATAAPAATTAPSLADKYPLITDPNINEPGTFPIAKEHVTLSIGLMQSPNVTSYEYDDNFMTRYITDKTNVGMTFELFPSVGTEANQKLELMVASGAPLPDIITGLTIPEDVPRFRYGQAGALIPLNDYFDQLGAEIRKGAAMISPTAYDDALRYTRSPDGNIYGVPFLDAFYGNHYSWRAWWNMTFLDALGLPIPQTQDEFVETLRAIRDGDPNGNGLKDEIPMVGSTNAWNGDAILWLMNQYTYVMSEANHRYTLIEDGKLDWAFDKDEWREGLRFAKSLVDEELLSSLSFTQDSAQYNALCQAEEMVIGLGVSGSVGGFGPNIKHQEGADAILGPNGSRYATYVPSLQRISTTITKDCANPALAFLFITSMYADDEFQLINRYGEAGLDFVYVAPSDNAVGLYEGAGVPARFRQVHQIWGTPQQSHWNYQEFPPALKRYEIFSSQAWDGDESSNETKNARVVTRLIPFTPDLSKVFFKNVFTTEEIEQTAEIRSVLVEYVREAYTLFVMGTMDLDRDWDAYLNELKNIGYAELLAIDQAAYNRTQGR